MNRAQRDAVYKTALQLFGIKNQALMLGEEQGELFKAVNKMIRLKDCLSGFDSENESDRLTEFRFYENIVEELADSVVMMEQVMLYFHIDEESVLRVVDSKVNRLEEMCAHIQRRKEDA